MRVALYVHGRARGHASRAVVIARALAAAGHSVVARAGGAARLALRDEAAVEVDAARGPIGKGPLGWAELALRVPRERAALRDFDVVVSDGDQPSLLAAFAEGMPSVSVGHDLALTACTLPDGLPRAAIWRERANSAISTHASARRIAVHFLGATPREPQTRVARLDLPELETGVGGPAVAYVSTWHDAPLAEAVIGAGVRVDCFGTGVDRGGFRHRTPERGAFLEALARAPYVLATSGSNVLAECVTYGKPVLALYDVRHDEQRLNALLVERAGVGLARRLDRVTAADVRELARRAETGGLARVDLRALLPPLSRVAVDELARLG